MKKTLALAIAGLIVTPAFAQSKVEIYGVVDMGYSWRSDNIDKDADDRHGIDSGQASGSRLGFRGTEDLGNGLKAGFVLEQGIHMDRGTSSQGNRTFGRQSYVSLGGNFGQVSLGRQYTSHHVLGVETDPFGRGSIGQYNNVYVGETRMDNLIAYQSPTWGGFSFVASYTGNHVGDESISNKNGDIEVFSVAPTFRSGPLMASFIYQEARKQRNGESDDKIKSYDLMGVYDFGVVKISGAYGIRNADNTDYLAGFANGEDSEMWMIGATIPLGANNVHKILASYTHRDTERVRGADGRRGSDARVDQWAIGYTYALSKRTDLYAIYSDINNNRAARNNALYGEVGDSTNDGNGYQQGAIFGIRHTF